jgi:tRNA (Thr-GGU) A37 N-methylase
MNATSSCETLPSSTRKTVLRVRGLDTFDGTPVLDLKPYLPGGDSLPEARVPDWLTRLQPSQ